MFSELTHWTHLVFNQVPTQTEVVYYVKKSSNEKKKEELR
jgi:hypothetical protein